MKTITSTMTTKTILSDDTSRRYAIIKEWDKKLPRLAIIMLNPTDCEGVTIDRTTLYILQNCVRLNFGAVTILNLFSTINDYKEKADDKANLSCILAECDKADKIVYASGTGKKNNKAFQERERTVLESLRKFQDKLFCITDSSGNYPLHPLCPKVYEWTLASANDLDLFKEVDNNNDDTGKSQTNGTD